MSLRHACKGSVSPSVPKSRVPLSLSPGCCCGLQPALSTPPKSARLRSSTSQSLSFSRFGLVAVRPPAEQSLGFGTAGVEGGGGRRDSGETEQSLEGEGPSAMLDISPRSQSGRFVVYRLFRRSMRDLVEAVLQTVFCVSAALRHGAHFFGRRLLLALFSDRLETPPKFAFWAGNWFRPFFLAFFANLTNFYPYLAS
jgi:hypothetical protein